MKEVINFINTYSWILLLILLGVLIILFVFIMVRKKKERVKPIDLEVLEQKEEPSEIEEVLAKLESGENNRPMTTFEQEQEENAIISYQELVKAVEEKKAKMNFVTEEKPKENATLEVEKKLEQKEVEVEETETKEKQMEESSKDGKFKNSEFISPVFGKDSPKNNDDFLKELKDFRKNL